MKPFIDECGIIHIAYMATAMFYQNKWLPLVKVYRLRLLDKYPGSPIFNIEHLKAYQEPTEEGRTTLPDSPLRKEESREYEVESILGHKRVGKTKALKYLVRWAGYGPQFDEWLTARDLRNASDVLREYRKRNNL